MYKSKLTISGPDEGKSDVAKLHENGDLSTDSKIYDCSYIQGEKAVAKQTHALEEGTRRFELTAYENYTFFHQAIIHLLISQLRLPTQ